MEPTFHLTPAPTLHLVKHDLRAEDRHDERYDEPTMDGRLERLLDTLDEIHDAAMTGELLKRSHLSKADLLGWLRDIIYTAEQTMVEIEDQGGEYGDTPHLALVRKSS
jgi:hypothetical protein